MQEKILVEKAKAGDKSAFEQIAKRYQKPLEHFVTRYLPDSEENKDIAQETLIALYKNLNKVDLNKSLSTYIFTIAKNKAISYLRKNKRLVPLDESIVGQTDIVIKDDWVKRAVDGLVSKYRQVIKLYYFENLHYDQISKVLQIPINTVRIHLHRAKIQLKKLLNKKYEDN